MLRHVERGFSLIEAVVAATIIAVALGALGRVTLAAARANSAGRSVTVAVLAARQKMEGLRALSVDHPSLAASPPEALLTNTTGYHDLLDADGRPAAPANAAFDRRWLIEPLDDSPGRAVLLQVRVSARRLRRGGRPVVVVGVHGATVR
jgi:prepilin-type N-terminal cleavage/methylation domain-containing protein